MTLSLSAAAKHVGKSKTTLTRAIKSGKLSATRHEDGSYSIDPAELSRVYTMRPVTQSRGGAVRDPHVTPDATPSVTLETEQLRLKVEMLEKMLVREQETVEDLRGRLDKAESRITALLPLDQSKRRWPWQR